MPFGAAIGAAAVQAATAYMAAKGGSSKPREPDLHDYAWYESQARESVRKANRDAWILIILVASTIGIVAWMIVGKA